MTADDGAGEFTPDSDWDAEGAIIRGLVARRNGEAVNGAEFELAVTVLAAQAFMRAGLSVEAAMDQVARLTANGATIRASLDSDGELSVTIEGTP